VSYMTVDRIIHRLEEFGPQYFILAQATGISEGDYRRISSAVKGQSLLHAGEEIPINTENAPRLAAAVEALKQRALPAAAENSSGEPDGDAATRALEKVDRALASVVDEIARLHNLSLHKDQRERLNKAVVAQLHRLPMFQFTELRRAG